MLMSPGKVTISPEDAVVGAELTATLTRAEGGVSASGQITDQSWMWHRSASDGFAADVGNAIASGVSSYLTTQISVDPDDSTYPKWRGAVCEGDG